jgi:hypothetical protein
MGRGMVGDRGQVPFLSRGAGKKKKKRPRRWVGAFFGSCWLRKAHFRVFRPLAPMSCSLQQMACTATNTSQLKPIRSASPVGALITPLWARGPSPHCTHTPAGRRAGPPEPRARRWGSCAWSLPACLPASWKLAVRACLWSWNLCLRYVYLDLIDT